MNRSFRSFTAAALAATCLFAMSPPGRAADAASPVALHLTRAQAETLDRAMPGRTIWVDVSCCGAETIANAVATVEMFRIVGGMSKAAPVFVTGADPTHVAQAVQRIVAGGMALVFVVEGDDATTMASAGDTALQTP